MKPSLADIDQAYRKALASLLAQRHPDGYWVGELSSSALSTATAVGALSLVQKQIGGNAYDQLIEGGLAWLKRHQNPDGGWGDTIKSFSNISTTMLCRAAFHLAGAAEAYPETLSRTDAWLGERYGRTPEELANAVRKRYGKDRTFSVPILTMCALAGLVSWREVPYLPFELACFPQSWFRFLRLHVVSYALPALIAIGQAVHHHRPPWNPFTRLVRGLARKRSLKVLEKIQPTSGGFLEATPLTSFVTMSLAGISLAEHPVACKGVEFLLRSARPDGSWPIDTNLSTWVTTLAINALAAAGEMQNVPRRFEVEQWLAAQQFTTIHPYTGARPGGWGWTNLPGSVPDGDDTPGAMIAIYHLEGNQEVDYLEKVTRDRDSYRNASVASIRGLLWLLGLQNRDGGWPTFCRGWGRLPFDRSGSDLTAHVLRAIATFLPAELKSLDLIPAHLDPSVRGLYLAFKNGLAYLGRQQRSDGSWLPLWFGNQHRPDEENPTYGTARVLAAYRDLDMMNSEPARRGLAWLVQNQNPDGGWGAGIGTPSSVEETALAVEILVDAGPETEAALNNGLAWLVEQVDVDAGALHDPSPIGFYFAKLWYFEKLYPMIFAVAALGKARRKRMHDELE